MRRCDRCRRRIWPWQHAVYRHPRFLRHVTCGRIERAVSDALATPLPAAWAPHDCDDWRDGECSRCEKIAGAAEPPLMPGPPLYPDGRPGSRWSLTAVCSVPYVLLASAVALGVPR